MVPSWNVILTRKGRVWANYSTLYEDNICNLVNDILADSGGLKAGDSISVEETQSEE